MKVEIDESVIAKFRESTTCYGMSRDEIKDYLYDLVDELLRDHLSQESFRENQSTNEDDD